MADGAGQRWRERNRHALRSVVTKRRIGLALKHNPFYTLKQALREFKKILSKLALPRFKQLLIVDGETLLQRQVRLLRQFGITDIYIASSSPKLNAKGAIQYRPVNNIYEIDRFSSSSELWNTEGETLYIYGDVFYTELAMSIICSTSATDWLWFGRPHASFIPNQPDPELFAFRFQAEYHEAVEKNINHVRAEYVEGRHFRCIGWDLLRSLENLPLSSPEIPDDRFREINDMTSDFDTLAEYHSWLEFYEKAKPTHVFSELNNILDEFRIEKHGIIHVGSHICRELDFYKRFTRICLIDANPLLGPYLKFISRWNPNVTTYNYAINVSKGELDFYITDYDQASSLFKPLEHSLMNVVLVNTIPLSACQEDHNVLVIDVQGAELKVLMSANLDPIDLIICEVNERQRYENAPASEEVVEFLSVAGFTPVKSYPHGNYGMLDFVFVKRSTKPDFPPQHIS